ncbi:hypothetical protein [Saccharopolyspora sp. ASAGF58]|uniref:hypothetical protein n=1 Tax=Saccharopolyspora sp. ASAGF58 TaxID=2719023 RepID=UPI00143FC8C9|nr:hypothetical protein [Saccharopolyspora sp. ASAGF58]QIZ36134.1 hypothetical protein FDZ84_17435 [Saccharopolyspora sp. ASAGF58]
MLAGFRFVHPRKVDSLLAVQGFRIRDSAIDMFIAHSAFDAVAARVRVEEMRFEGPSPALWERRGAVADVVMELVALPPHGAPNAPKLARARSLDLLWVPGNAMS